MIEVSTLGCCSYCCVLPNRLDSATYYELRDSLNTVLNTKNGVNTIVIDLSNVSYLDSSVWAMLLLTRNKAKCLGLDISLANLTSTVYEAFNRMHFHKLFAIN